MLRWPSARLTCVVGNALSCARTRNAPCFLGSFSIQKPPSFHTSKAKFVGYASSSSSASASNVEHLNVYFKILGVKHTDSVDEIKRAFYKKAKSVHPDLNHGSDPEKFRILKEAYDILCDPTRQQQRANATSNNSGSRKPQWPKYSTNFYQQQQQQQQQQHHHYYQQQHDDDHNQEQQHQQQGQYLLEKLQRRLSYLLGVQDASLLFPASTPEAKEKDMRDFLRKLEHDRPSFVRLQRYANHHDNDETTRQRWYAVMTAFCREEYLDFRLTRVLKQLQNDIESNPMVNFPSKFRLVEQPGEDLLALLVSDDVLFNRDELQLRREHQARQRLERQEQLRRWRQQYLADADADADDPHHQYQYEDEDNNNNNNNSLYDDTMVEIASISKRANPWTGAFTGFDVGLRRLRNAESYYSILTKAWVVRRNNGYDPRATPIMGISSLQRNSNSSNYNASYSEEAIKEGTTSGSDANSNLYFNVNLTHFTDEFEWRGVFAHNLRYQAPSPLTTATTTQPADDEASPATTTTALEASSESPPAAELLESADNNNDNDYEDNDNESDETAPENPEATSWKYAILHDQPAKVFANYLRALHEINKSKTMYALLDHDYIANSSNSNSNKSTNKSTAPENKKKNKPPQIRKNDLAVVEQITANDDRVISVFVQEELSTVLPYKKLLFYETPTQKRHISTTKQKQQQQQQQQSDANDDDDNNNNNNYETHHYDGQQQQQQQQQPELIATAVQHQRLDHVEWEVSVHKPRVVHPALYAMVVANEVFGSAAPPQPAQETEREEEEEE